MYADFVAVQIREARVEDYPRFVRWFPMLGSGDAVPSQAVWATALAPSATVAEIEQTPAGYCYTQVFAHDGYIRHLVVDPAQRGQGVGRALLERAADRMRNQGCARWRLNVKPDNTPARTLYESMGMREVRACASVRFPWSAVDELPPPSVELQGVEPDADQRAQLESTFDLSVGQLDPGANRPGSVVRAVVDGSGALHGVAVFDPGHPGAFPFRVRSTDAACGLLATLRSFATSPDMGIVSEDDPAVEHALTRVGARVAFRFIHMCGPL